MTDHSKKFTRVSEEERDEIVSFWKGEFGVSPEVFEDYRIYMKGENKTWITESQFFEEVGEDYDFESVGLPFLRVNQEHPKPTTDALQVFGEHATKNVIELTSEEAKEFVSGETVERKFDVDSLGYVIATHENEVLGCGLYFPGELRSQIPKGRRVGLEFRD